MNLKELRAEYLRLTHLNSISDCIDLFDIFLDYFWHVIDNHHYEKVTSQADADAKMINQMMFSKALHLRKLSEGVGYKGSNDKNLNPIVDPTIFASLVRNVFETSAMFNLVYRSTKSPDEKAILYGLWVVSGLQFRQRFESSARSDDSKKKVSNEKAQIESVIKEIKATELYKSLNEKNQAKIDTKIKEKDYKIKFDGADVVFLHWHEMSDIMGLHKELYENIYTFFSLYAHPSYVSVFQFEEMFSKEDRPFLQLTATNLKYCFSLLSAFIADYINLFPQVRKTFDSMSLINQIALNAHNKLLRGDEYSINDAWKELG